MNTYWRLLGFVRPIGKFAVPYFFYTLFYALFNTFTYVLVIPVLNTLFNSTEGIVHVTSMPSFALSGEYLQDAISFVLYKIHGTDYGIMDVLVLLAGFITVSAMLSNFFRYMGQWTAEKVRIMTMERMRNSVFDNVMNLHVGYFSNERKGDIMSKISADVQIIQYTVTSTLQVMFREPFLIIGYVVVLVGISWKLTIFAILFLPLVAAIIGGIVRYLKKPARLAQEKFGEMVSLLDESLTGVKIIKGYNASEYIKNKFHKINEAFSSLSRSMARRQQLSSPISEFLGITAVAVILIFGGGLVIDSKLDAGAFIVYIGIFSQITRPVRAITDSLSNINQGIAAGDRVLGLLDEKSLITSAPDAVPLTEFKHEIEFRNVSFSYESKLIIDDVSFKIRKGETIALVGPSGGGKSTISDLIPRFYDVQGGQILIDGTDIRQYNVEGLRSHMGIVAQETILFNDTIANNIGLGKQGATEAEIGNAARVANAHDFIMETDNGYQTNIGDRGMKLSGGQRQRLSIARAVLKNPSILILDEATSALDTESEKLVQGALNALLKGRTSLVIAHRLSTINNADHIIVIDKGRIAEQGTHKQLIAQNGIYAKLIEMQQLA